MLCMPLHPTARAREEKVPRGTGVLTQKREGGVLGKLASALPRPADSELCSVFEALPNVTATCHNSDQITSRACFTIVTSAPNP